MTLCAGGFDGAEVEDNPSSLFDRQTDCKGAERLLISVPIDQPDLFSKLANELEQPLYLLYILHTSRGEGEVGRYQSTELTLSEVQSFLKDFGDFLYGDARQDIWVYSPSTKRTLVWTRHNQIFAEGHPLNDVIDALRKLGFREEKIAPLSDHIHHYRKEFDMDATNLLESIHWYRTALRPEDEQ